MPETVSDTRSQLTKHVQRFRDEGIDAAPVIFGGRTTLAEAADELGVDLDAL